jgi:hypothetical protein
MDAAHERPMTTTINSAREAFCLFVNVKRHLGHRFVMAQHHGPTAELPETWWVWFTCKTCGLRAGAVVSPSCVPDFPYISTYEPIHPCSLTTELK